MFLEIVAPERIVFTDAFGPGWVPSTKAFMTAVVTFEEFHGKTLYTARAWHWNAADCQAHDDMGFHRGWGKVSSGWWRLLPIRCRIDTSCLEGALRAPSRPVVWA